MTAQEILKAYRTVAVIGLSSRETRPSYGVSRYMQANGYRIPFAVVEEAAVDAHLAAKAPGRVVRPDFPTVAPRHVEPGVPTLRVDSVVAMELGRRLDVTLVRIPRTPLGARGCAHPKKGEEQEG